MIGHCLIRVRPIAASVMLVLGTAAALTGQGSPVLLWPDGAPGSENWTQKEAVYAGGDGHQRVRNVSRPSITPYLPPSGTGTGTAVIVAPGGAFRILAWTHEGTMVAEWLQRRGIAAFVLKYRLVDTGTDEEFVQAETAMRGRGAGAAGRAGRSGGAPGSPGERGAPPRGGIPTMDNPVVRMSVTDSLKAIETVRSRAREWQIDPAKVGILGFSAGAWAAVMTGVEQTAATRPDFIAAIYPCCLNANNALNATNLQIPPDAPPLFLTHAYDDPIASAAPVLFQTWKAAGRPAELHSYAAGGHGFGMNTRGLPVDTWIERLADWMRYSKF